MLPSLISVDDVLVLWVERELARCNTQQTTASMKRNTSGPVFVFCSPVSLLYLVVSSLIQLPQQTWDIEQMLRTFSSLLELLTDQFTVGLIFVTMYCKAKAVVPKFSGITWISMTDAMLKYQNLSGLVMETQYYRKFIIISLLIGNPLVQFDDS